jgi:F0F1-type ATP synthase membrane subunit c/vacuolar-type H+-ATPase subunit K
MLDNPIISYGFIVLVAAGCIAMIAMSAHRSMARQPEIQNRAFITFVLGAAFCEMLGLLGFVLAFVG